jgi:hypothetical protein
MQNLQLLDLQLLIEAQHIDDHHLDAMHGVLPVGTFYRYHHDFPHTSAATVRTDGSSYLLPGRIFFDTKQDRQT